MASEYFRKLTCGVFQGLRSDYDESGQEVLVGVRPSGATLRVEAMSEGTRDQLYLALRLGTLDHWFERHEAVPFVVDDVLLTFDDSRASAALATLIDLSKRTQVLLFTHHEHLVSLVRKIVAAHAATTNVNIITEWKNGSHNKTTDRVHEGTTMVPDTNVVTATTLKHWEFHFLRHNCCHASDRKAGHRACF